MTAWLSAPDANAGLLRLSASLFSTAPGIRFIFPRQPALLFVSFSAPPAAPPRLYKRPFSDFSCYFAGLMQ